MSAVPTTSDRPLSWQTSELHLSASDYYAPHFDSRYTSRPSLFHVKQPNTDAAIMRSIESVPWRSSASLHSRHGEVW